MTRDLYLSAYAPALGTGRAQRTYTCVRALAQLGPVDLAYVPFDGQEPSAEYTSIDGLEFHRIEPSRGPRRASTYLSTRLRGVPRNYARGVSAELLGEAQRLAMQPGRGRVIAGDPNTAAALLRLPRDRPFIYNAHNIESSYVSHVQGNRFLTSMALRAYERRLLAVAAESWMVSPTDLESARALMPDARLRYVPNVVDVKAIEPGNRTQTEPDEHMLMVGDFTYTPNLIGRDLLADSILPIVWRSLPDARLTLAGRGLSDWPAPDPRIKVAGFVENLAPLYDAADCVLVPITEGAGTPLKFIEALARQVPVVATPFAASGLELVAGRHYLEGADSASFAAQVIAVLRSGAPQIAAAGRAVAEAKYSVEALAERIAA